MRIPRGIRNKNPMNIRRTADHWVGMAEVQHDSSFVEFTSFKYGYRAAFIILHRYMNTYGIEPCILKEFEELGLCHFLSPCRFVSGRSPTFIGLYPHP